jgi:hypothetical protein
VLQTLRKWVYACSGIDKQDRRKVNDRRISLRFIDIAPVPPPYSTAGTRRPADMSEMRDQLLAELAAARATVARLEAALDEVNLDRDNSTSSNVANEERHAPRPRKAAARDWPLDLREYMRYGRQMILPQIGLQGESRSFRPRGAEI